MSEISPKLQILVQHQKIKGTFTTPTEVKEWNSDQG